MDQANRLRDIVKQRDSQLGLGKEPITARVITVTSGKGGVGKSNLTLNLAIQLRKLDKRVVIIDADLGLANIEVLTGIIPRYNFGDVVNAKMSLTAALTEGPMGIKFLSGGAGLTALANLNERQIATVINSFGKLDEISDIILIDTGAGISRNVINYVKASSETILLVTPEPTSIADAYAIMKAARKESDVIPILKIVVNLVNHYMEGIDIFERLNKVAEQFLSIQLQRLGIIPTDSCMVRAVKRQEPLATCFPTSEAMKSIENISLRLLNMEPKYNLNYTGITSFMNRLVSNFRA
ncbi:MAG: MinD/ParA family protein [Clostridiales bacterium]|jgi:flagellar biosynthesis protein FlhG|nr:MinD/ParA family protein [Clostridiales bacterium]